jgi:hypothetical protein
MQQLTLFNPEDYSQGSLELLRKTIRLLAEALEDGEPSAAVGGPEVATHDVDAA